MDIGGYSPEKSGMLAQLADAAISVNGNQSYGKQLILKLAVGQNMNRRIIGGISHGSAVFAPRFEQYIAGAAKLCLQKICPKFSRGREHLVGTDFLDGGGNLIGSCRCV